MVQPSPFTYALSDYFALTAQSWRMWLLVFLLIPFLVLLIPILFALVDGWSLHAARALLDWQLFLGLIAAFGCLMAVTIALKYWLGVRRGLIGETTAQITTGGLEIANSKIQSKIAWRAITRIVRTRNRIFLFLAPRTAVIVPGRAFVNADDFAAWAEQSERYWQAAKTLTVE